MLAPRPNDLHALEAELRGERYYTQALLQALPLGVCTVDGDGRVVSLNAEGERLLGWSETVCVGTFLHDIIGCHVEQGESRRRGLSDQTGPAVWQTSVGLAECLAAPYW